MAGKEITAHNLRVVANRVLYTLNEKRILKEYLATKPLWTVLEVLGIKELLPSKRMEIVLNERLIDANTLHVFANACAMFALYYANVKPDSFLMQAMRTKDMWLDGKITTKQLINARKNVISNAPKSGWAWACVRDCLRVDAERAAQCAMWSLMKGYGEGKAMLLMRTLKALIDEKEAKK